MSFPMRCLLGIGWGLAFWATLQISTIKLPGTHAVCGPWGCGPPSEALVACHGAWLVLLAPLAWMATRRLSMEQLWWLALGLVIFGGVGIMTVVAHERLTWFADASEWHRAYFWQRCGFRVVTMTDVPLLQALLLGLWMGSELACRRISRFSPRPLPSRGPVSSLQ